MSEIDLNHHGMKYKLPQRIETQIAATSRLMPFVPHCVDFFSLGKVHVRSKNMWGVGFVSESEESENGCNIHLEMNWWKAIG